MKKCVRCGKIIRAEEDSNILELVKHVKPFFTKKVIKRSLLCNECLDEYNKFFIGDE